jgi:hypothetical protein
MGRDATPVDACAATVTNDSANLARHLQTIVTTLSLDVAIPLWSPSGLTLDRLTCALVSAIAKRAFRLLHGDEASPYAIDYSQSRTASIRDFFCEELLRECGAEVRDRVLQWSEALVSAASDRDWFQGVSACYELLNDPVRGFGKVVLDAPDRERVLTLIAERLRNSADAALNERVNVPETDWDKRVFHLFADTGPPTSRVSLLLLRRRYDTVVREIENDLSDRGARAFKGWLSRRVRELNEMAVPPRV